MPFGERVPARDVLGVGSTPPHSYWSPPGTTRNESTPTPRSRTCAESRRSPPVGQDPSHRLNQGGDRAVNHALWRIAVVRLTCDNRTRTYMARRTAEEQSGRAVMSSLKRYIARGIFKVLTNPTGARPTWR